MLLPFLEEADFGLNMVSELSRLRDYMCYLIHSGLMVTICLHSGLFCSSESPFVRFSSFTVMASFMLP